MTWPEIYICHYGNEYDQIFTENLEAYFLQSNLTSQKIELSTADRDGQLLAVLKNNNAVVLGYNSQLDHSYIRGENFLAAAAVQKIPVIQWILDHPASRWAEFSANSIRHSAFLVNTDTEKHYFNRFCAPGANVGLMGGVGPNSRSRISEISEDQFLARPGTCLVALGLKRIGKAIEDTLAEINSLEPKIAKVINQAVMAARTDLEGPLEVHLIGALQKEGIFVDYKRFNAYFRKMEDCVQAFRRLAIFETARRYPVSILSDASAAVDAQGVIAEFQMDVSMRSTLSRMVNFRSVLSVSPLNDLIHDRTMNGINSGCIPVIEDNYIHRKVFIHGVNALMFRYGDESLEECLNIVCNDPGRSWDIAKQAFALRDDSRIFCISFGNFVQVAARQLSDLDDGSGVALKNGGGNQKLLGNGQRSSTGSDRESEQPRDVERTRELEGIDDVKERLKRARSAACQAMCTSVNLAADLHAKDDEIAALKRQIEKVGGEAEVLADRLQFEIREARGDAEHLRTRLTLLVKHLEQVQFEYKPIFVSPLDTQEVTSFSRSLSAPIDKRDNGVLKLAQDVMNLDACICTLRRELVRRDNQIAVLKRDILNQNNHIIEFTQQIADRDGRIVELDQEVASSDCRILELHEQVASSGRRILELDQQVANSDRRILELDQQVARSDRRILELDQQVANSDRRVLELGQQLDKLMSSSSWRITAPLRAAFKYLSPSQIRLIRRIIKLLTRRSQRAASRRD